MMGMSARNLCKEQISSQQSKHEFVLYVSFGTQLYCADASYNTLFDIRYGIRHTFVALPDVLLHHT